MKKQGFIIPFVVIIIVVLIIGGGIYAYKNQKEKKEGALLTKDKICAAEIGFGPPPEIPYEEQCRKICNGHIKYIPPPEHTYDLGGTYYCLGEITAPTEFNLKWDEQKIYFESTTVLTIDEFPDEIKVSKDASFGSSDKIKGVELSPDGGWLAIAVGGAAHDFGWVYNISTKKLTPVVFSYGGGVKVYGWRNYTSVVFTVETPKPDTIEETVDIENLPQYPL
jgi:hypothetical protein